MAITKYRLRSRAKLSCGWLDQRSKAYPICCEMRCRQLRRNAIEFQRLSSGKIKGRLPACETCCPVGFTFTDWQLLYSLLPKSLSIFTRDDERFHHFGLDEVSVELIQLR